MSLLSPEQEAYLRLKGLKRSHSEEEILHMHLNLHTTIQHRNWRSEVMLIDQVIRVIMDVSSISSVTAEYLHYYRDTCVGNSVGIWLNIISYMTRLNFKPFEPVSSENSGEIT
jgi:hypothetical protein